MDNIAANKIIIYIILGVCDVYLIRRNSLDPNVQLSRYLRLHLFSLLLYKIVMFFTIFFTKKIALIMCFNDVLFFFLFQPYIWFSLCFDYIRPKRMVKIIIKHILLTIIVLLIVLIDLNCIPCLWNSEISKFAGFFQDVVHDGSITLKILYIFYIILGGTCFLMFLSAFFKTSKMQRKFFPIVTFLFFLPWIIWLISNLFQLENNIETYLFYFISCTTYFFSFLNKNIEFTIPIATETVFRHSSEAIALIGNDNNIFDVNDAFLKLYPDLTPKINKVIKKAKFSDFEGLHREFSGIEDEKSITFEHEKDGKLRYYSARIEAIYTEDRVTIGKLLVINDVTVFAENEKILETKAETNEMLFLQAQIKPHFLNNSLNVIASLIKRNPDTARDLLADLGDFLRCSYFESENPMILLEEELEMTEKYINIEKERLMERLRFKVFCENMPHIYLPRLILQPLVENAVSHGIFHKPDGGCVLLKIITEEEKIVFKVIDNGIGISSDMIQWLLSGKNKGYGVGIANIQNRLIKYYGKGLSIKSISGRGTIVSFSIPINKNILEEDNDNDKNNNS